MFEKYIKTFLKKLNIGITTYSGLVNMHQEIEKKAAKQRDLEILLALSNHQNGNQLLNYFKKSKSQFRQDLFVLSQLDFKKGGYFVEFGATNGLHLSNTFLLEKEFGWTGILAEPAKCWHLALKNNRNCHIETLCVWKDSSSVLDFNEVEIAELSTLSEFSDVDRHRNERKKRKLYQVKTISINDLLKKYNAPNHIDYLSIDTEGSEFVILNNLDFSKYSFKVITCEHNSTAIREKIFNLLAANGYTRVHENFSACDDWYVKLV